MIVELPYVFKFSLFTNPILFLLRKHSFFIKRRLPNFRSTVNRFFILFKCRLISIVYHFQDYFNAIVFTSSSKIFSTRFPVFLTHFILRKVHLTSFLQSHTYRASLKSIQKRKLQSGPPLNVL